MSEVALRDYQIESVERARAGVAAGRRKQVLMAPAGAGKTEIACFMLQEASKKYSRAMFIVDRVVLVDQTSERLDRYGISHGVIQSGHWRWKPYERIQVCSAQTLERRGIPADVQVVFVDEAHCMRKKVTEFLNQTDAVVVGLTATPFTKGMGKVYEGLVNVTTTNELIARGYLSPLKIYAAKAIDVTGMKVVAGEWSEKEIEQRGLAIIGDIVAEWQDKTEKHFGGPVKTIVFSATVDHGAELVRQFQAAGFDFRQISYKDGGDDVRRAIIEEFRKPDSTIHGLVSCEVFTKGFDVPDVMCGISARPYRKSLSSHIQQMGRVMRASPGKEYGLWLDHSGNVMRFYADTETIFQDGMTELDEGRLESKTRKEPTEQERDAIKCQCGAVMSMADVKCPSCGKERKRRTLIEQQPGELVEIDGNTRNRKTGWDDKIHFIAQLRAFARAHGYQEGWVAHKYRSRYGVWPNDPRLKHVAPAPYGVDVANWLKSQAIRYAKSRAAA